MTTQRGWTAGFSERRGIDPRLAALGFVALLLTTLAPAAGQALESPSEPAAEETIFLAPFTSVSFLRAVREEMIRRKILQERMTGVFIDLKAGLVWTARDNGLDIDWKRASDYCQTLQLAGFDDWRLPSLEQLQSLIQPLDRGEYSTPDLIQLSACCPWSSTEKSEIAAWNLNFKYSKAFSGSKTHTYDLRALCVRDLQPSDNLPETGEELEMEPDGKPVR